ncbi:MAG: Bacterial rane protein YfhO [Mucilaginibacter sp.]|nr:Bacterial rane protein YfhO [Mucilaginibacter sp.]
MNNWFKRNSIHFLVAAIFLVVCFLYFTPAFQGKTLGQGDVLGAQSTQKEINDYKAKDTTILWTNQIYGGMPAFQIWAPYPNNLTTWVVKDVTAMFPNPIYLAFILFFGAYFLFNVLKLNPWLAAAGAIAFTFSTYNIVLLAAGHSNQAFAICFFAPILASIILILRGNYWLGGSLMALFLSMEIRANHIQMTYYLLIVILIFIGFELYRAVKDKTIDAFIKSMGFIAVATLLAIIVNASLLWSTYDYGKDTIRGQSNLTQHIKEPSNGLTKDYAYEYSQTVGETLTFLVPNAYGGETGLSSIDVPNSNLVKAFESSRVPQDQAERLVQGLSSYWGDKPLTSGPHYLGAVICFLFIYGLLIVKSRLKWWLLASVTLTILLSFGNSFPYVSDLFFSYFPLYNKFRAIESILSITGLCVPILALLAVNEVITDTDKATLFKKLKTALYITGGLALILIIYPELFLSFKQSGQLAFTGQISQFLGGNNEAASNIMNALVKDREDIERADAIRSLVFILLTFGIIWAFIKQKISATILSVAFAAIILVDLWQVDKRFLKDDSFQDKQDVEQVVKPRQVDQFIAKDPDPDFRVFDLTADIKRDTYNPFFHKSISGYSAARLKRYDELIDNQLAVNPPNHDVLDMLNTKYLIEQDKSGNLSMVANVTACGHSWFVKSVKLVDNADQEMQAISSFAPKDEAIVDKQYKSLINGRQLGGDPNATIKLTNYNPDHLTYQTGSTTDQVAIFSEIYYSKGWKMLIDGKEQPYFRADYLLRAALIPVGNHKIEFIFHPASYYTGEKISMAGSVLLALALAGAVYTETKRKKPVVVTKKK